MRDVVALEYHTVGCHLKLTAGRVQNCHGENDQCNRSPCRNLVGGYLE